MADNLEDLEVQFGAWKQCLESKGLRINIVKSNVMICDRSQGPFLKSGKYPCGVCFKSVGSNSILARSANAGYTPDAVVSTVSYRMQ